VARLDFSVSNLILVLVVWIAAERVTFPVANGWASPTMLAFVPMVFMLPTPVVPLVATVAIVLRRAPEMLGRRVRLTMIPVFIADAWFTIGAALVIVLAGAQQFSCRTGQSMSGPSAPRPTITTRGCTAATWSISR
jgi:hypothetical protein